MQPARDRDLRDLLGETLAVDPRRRVDAVRSLSATLPPSTSDPLVAAGWDRVLELADDPEPVERRTVLHVLGEAPAQRADDVEAALHRLCADEDDSLRRRARKVHDRLRRLRAA